MDRSKSWKLSISRPGRALGVVLVILVAAAGTLTYLWVSVRSFDIGPRRDRYGTDGEVRQAHGQ